MKNKQKSSLAPISNNSQTDETPAMETLKNTSKKIQKGYERKTASTGTPIEDLHGGAKFLAQLSNVGGGSVETGGGGIKEGFSIILQHAEAIGKVNAISNPSLMSDKKE